MECEILRSPMISYRSLLYSITILYDELMYVISGSLRIRSGYRLVSFVRLP